MQSGTGGYIGMLNNNQLANSDFYTGAFPAEFGNATSGFNYTLRFNPSTRLENRLYYQLFRQDITQKEV